jgi:hypothetical protein
MQEQNLTNKVGELYNSIIMNNNVISSVVSNKCLGVDLDDRLTFIGALRRIKPFVPQTSLVTLYKSLIQSYFDYCSPLWGTCDKILKDKLQILQNRAARVITGARYDDRIRSNDILEGLGWDYLHDRRAKLKSILMYKILNENCSPCLRESLVRVR